MLKRLNLKKLGANIAGVVLGVSAIIHALPPEVVSEFHVPEILSVIAAIIAGYQRSFVKDPPKAPEDPFVR